MSIILLAIIGVLIYLLVKDGEKFKNNKKIKM
jgi:hypothetical protein